MTPLPNHLAGTAPQGRVEPGEPVAQFEIGDYKNFVYLVLDWESRRAALVDPQRDVETPLKALRDQGFQLAAVLLTHTHHDHIAGVPELAKRFPELPFVLHEKDAHRLPPALKTHHAVDGEEISLGGLKIRALHTPGHSAGETSYFFSANGRDYLLTGDTVFVRDCGRTDLATGNTAEMFETLQRLKTLPAGTVILPGHHYAPECATTLEKEMRESPPFRCRTVDELAALP